MVEVVLQDHRGGYCIQLAALADAADRAPLGANDGFGISCGKALIPDLGGHAKHARDQPRKLLRASSLRTNRAIRVQWQTHDDSSYPLPPNKVAECIQHWCNTSAALQHEYRAGEQAELITQRNSYASLAGVDAQHSRLRHRPLTLGPERLRRLETRAAPT